MKSLHKMGHLNIGIDSLTVKEMTNNSNILQLVDDPKLLKATWSAYNFWMFGMFGLFVYQFEFHYGMVGIHWYGGFSTNPHLTKSNEENLLETMLKDKGLYEAMHTAKRLNFQVDESALQVLKKVKYHHIYRIINGVHQEIDSLFQIHIHTY